MRTLSAAATLAAAFLVIGGAAGCSFAANAADMQVGDCLRFVGTADLPQVEKVTCGSAESSYKVVETVADSEDCPTDVDTYFSMTSGDSTTTVCMDVDWVVGQCMSLDPENDSDPVRADCYDTSIPNRQRASKIMTDIADADRCSSGVGYTYPERNFTVCVEDMP